jgi:N-carbamoylputrescine amidase
VHLEDHHVGLRTRRVRECLELADRAEEQRPEQSPGLAAGAIGQGREVGRYRKTHIPAYFPTEGPGGTGSFEKFYFTPGASLPVFAVAGTTIGIQICNDRLYPEASRALAMAGAEMLVMPIAYSTYADPAQRTSIWEVPLRARA